MKRNLGEYDAVFRVIVGACLLILFSVNDMYAALTWITLLVSGLLLMTGISGHCPIYQVLRISTRIHHRRKTRSR